MEILDFDWMQGHSCGAMEAGMMKAKNKYELAEMEGLPRCSFIKGW